MMIVHSIVAQSLLSSAVMSGVVLIRGGVWDREDGQWQIVAI